MIEKNIYLEGISLIDFLGEHNRHIKLLTDTFPNIKIVYRGNQLKIKGEENEIIRLNTLIQKLISHIQKHRSLDDANIRSYIDSMYEDKHRMDNIDSECILFGLKGLIIKPQTKNQVKLVEAIQKHDITFAVGAAGSGKTYISVAMAVRALKKKQVKRIIITRPVLEAGERLGFLPGDISDKITPYLSPIYSALEEMIPNDKVESYLQSKIIEIAPLAYMRGRTLKNAFVILDEAQNTTSIQMKMFLTRMGLHSKMAICGDTSQVDLSDQHTSGLAHALHLLKNIKGIARVEFTEEDVMRHGLVKDILKAYKDEH